MERKGKRKNKKTKFKKKLKGRDPNDKSRGLFLMIFFYLLSFTQQIPRFKPYLGSKPKRLFFMKIKPRTPP
jgi:hypothetical protein